MKSKSILLIAVIACVLTGCTENYYEEKKADLNQAFIANTMGEGYFYQGSDNTHHYFICRLNLGSDKRFKIKKTDLQVSEEKPFGMGETRVFSLKPQNPEIKCKPFATIGQQTIYIEE